MATAILIPTALRQFTEGGSEVEGSGKTAGETIRALVAAYPDLKNHLFNDKDALRSFINVYVNEENIKQKQGLDTPVNDGDTVMLVPSIAGGSGKDDGPSGPPSGADVTGVGTERELPQLANDEIARYSRHLILSEIGVEGQRKLKGARVLVVGTGGLGAPLAMYLAAAGIGTLGIVDFDCVEESNLQRQVIHGTRDIGRPKVSSAEDRIKGINPKIKVVTYNVKLTSQNALDIIRDYDAVADGTDNFQTRYLVNDASVLLGKPNVYGSIFRFEGQASVFGAKDGPCYRCLYPEPPPPGLVPSCAEGGVLGVLPGIVGCIQANEVIKLIVGGGEPLSGRLLLFDSWKMKFRELKITKDPECPICGKHRTIHELVDYEEFCGLKKNNDAEAIDEIAAADLKKRFDSGDAITVIDIREQHERNIAPFPGAKNIPLGQIVRRKEELDPSIDTVFVCKVGQRSALAIKALRDSGYPGKLLNLRDGIISWAKDVDTSMPTY